MFIVECERDGQHFTEDFLVYVDAKDYAVMKIEDGCSVKVKRKGRPQTLRAEGTPATGLIEYNSIRQAKRLDKKEPAL